MYERTSGTLHYTLVNLTFCKKPYSLTVMMTHVTSAFPTANLIDRLCGNASISNYRVCILHPYGNLFFPHALSIQERGMTLCMLHYCFS